jgi:hypothetical protein
MCEIAADKFLKLSWEYDGKELHDISQFLRRLELRAKYTDGDIGLGFLGAHGEKAFVSTDGEGTEKQPCEDDAGFGTEEHGIELITLNGPGCSWRWLIARWWSRGRLT